MSTRPEVSVHAWRILLLALARIEPGTDFTIDQIRDECDAAGLSSSEKSGALRHACTLEYLDGAHIRDDGSRVFQSVISRHPAGKSRLVKLYTRTSKPVPLHVCREVA